MITWNAAKDLLTALTNVSAIQEVVVVGSLARFNACWRAQGNDLDVVLVVGWPIYLEYLRFLEGEAELYSLKYERNAAAMATIPFSPAEYGWVEQESWKMTSSGQMDIHLMPPGWESSPEVVQHHLNHEDPNFVRNIAADARHLRTTEVQWGMKYVDGWA